MKIPQLSGIGNNIQLSEGIPESYTGFLLSADTFFSEERFGLFVIQQQNIGDKWMRYFVLKPKEIINLSLEGNENFFHLFINLSHGIKLKTAPNRTIPIHQAQFLPGYGTRNRHSIELKAGKEYEFLQLFFPNEKVREFELPFPFLKNLPAKPIWIMARTIEWIKEIISNPYTDPARHIYYEISFDHLFFLLLLQSGRPPVLKADDWEIEAVYKAKTLIEENIRNYPDIKAIGRQVGLTEYKLKLLLKQVFGKNAFELFMKAKMDRAYQLVTTTNDSIKAIAIDTGFKWAMNFVTGFRQHFGEAPETLREKLKNRKE